MKKLLFIIVLGMMMTSCSRYTSLGSGGCGAWGPKKYTGTYKASKQSYRYRTGVH